MKTFDITLYCEQRQTFVRKKAKTYFIALLNVMRERKKDIYACKVNKVKILEAKVL